MRAIDTVIGSVLSNENHIRSITDGFSHLDFLMEKELSSTDRKKIPDMEFGLPALRKYPLADKKHVSNAIVYFNKVDKKDEAELAKNIKKKIKQFGMSVSVSDENRFSKYYKED